jgi:hypothetical protein
MAKRVEYKTRTRSIPRCRAIGDLFCHAVWATAPVVDSKPTFRKGSAAVLALLHPVDVERFLGRAIERFDLIPAHGGCTL